MLQHHDHCSSRKEKKKKSAGGFFKISIGRCPSGILTFTHPVQLFLEKIMVETLPNQHTSISIGSRS